MTVHRGFAGTPAQDIIIGGGTEIAIQLIGNAFEEASERPRGHAINPHTRTNLVQIFRTSWDISGTARAVSYRLGDRKARNKAAAALEHATQIETSLIWGKRHTGAIDNKPFRVMDGVINQIQSNRFISPAGGLTRRACDDFIERVYATRPKGMPNERIFLAGNVALRALNEIAFRYGHYNTTKSETLFGMKVNTIQNSFGEMKLMIHPMMNDSPVWNSEIYALHPGVMETKYLRRTFHTDESKGAASDLRDADAGAFTSELTCTYRLEQTGAIMHGVAVDHYVVE